MAKNETVTLKLKPGSNGGTGWQDVTASNGQPYCFKYSGGDQGKGGLHTKVGEGQGSIALSVDTDNRYSINNVCFTNDTYSQLSWTPTSGNNATGTISDANSQPETADYAVVVMDAMGGNCTITCDPMIQNDPRGPMPVPRIQHH